MLGGPMMNLVIAVVLFGGHLHPLRPAPRSRRSSRSVSECVDVKKAGQNTPDECTPDMPVAPANAAGLRPGDELVSVAGTAGEDVGRRPGRHPRQVDKPMTIVFERDGQQQTVDAKPLVLDLPVYDDQGRPTTDASGEVITERAGFLGDRGTARDRPAAGHRRSGPDRGAVARTAGVVLRIPEKMVGVAEAAFGVRRARPRRADLRRRRRPGRRRGRERRQVRDRRRHHGASSSRSSGSSASLNLALFVFNLIPLLPLDGGHVAGALWEGLKRHGARLLGRPDPGYVDVAKALPVAYAVSSVLIVMSVLLIYADIVKPVRLGG